MEAIHFGQPSRVKGKEEEKQNKKAVDNNWTTTKGAE